MRLGLDIGTTSIGWWLYTTTGQGALARITGVIDGGVRIFSDGRDPKSKASLAVDRRAARAMRRRRDRYLRRRATLMKVLAKAGLMPDDPTAAKQLELLDPYELRARGLDDALPLTHFGRACFTSINGGDLNRTGKRIAATMKVAKSKMPLRDWIRK